MKKALYIHTTFFLLLSFFTLNAQHQAVYVPTDLSPLEDYLEEINEAHLKRIKGKHAARIKKFFKKRDEKVIKQIKDSVYLFHDDFEDYLEKILEEIYTNNSEIDHSRYRFFLRNSIAPNASCYGDGMFDVYLGLIDTLDSDDEIAFVLCHEMAHQILDHPLNNITQAIERLNSDETKQKVKSIKRQKYGRTRAALSVIDELNIDFLKHSKNVEAQADSLGFVLFRNTKYNKAKAISALRRLQLVDDMLLRHQVKVDSVFNFTAYPFKKFWLEDEVSLFAVDEKINDYEMVSDTLKTHPEVPYRVAKLIREFNIDTTSFIPTGEALDKIEGLVHEQAIQTFIDLKQLDFALYQLEKKHAEQHISEAIYAEKMMLILKAAYVARKKHELGKYVPQKNGFSDEKELNNIRKFWHALELKEIKTIAQHFYQRVHQSIPEDKINQFDIFKN